MKKLTTEEFIAKAKLIHGDKYDYSLVEYVNNRLKVTIICPFHGEFIQSPVEHLKGSGCKLCYYKKSATNQKMSIDNFKREASKRHNNKYDYSLLDYNNIKTKIKIICPLHGIFEQYPNSHLYRLHGCPICNSSKGEIKIKKLLEDNKINFIPQKKFDECKNKQKLPFDFYLPDYNVVIEYQGRQHFQQIGNWDLLSTQYNDKLKKDYCSLKGIRLLEITYKDDVEKVLNQFLCENSPNSLSQLELPRLP
jgi:hypothetical protein